MVVNLKYEPFDIYIGRPSIWGNPFVLRKGMQRGPILEAYRAYILKRPDLLARLPELRGKRLVCYCAPLPCHGDVLVELCNKFTVGG